MKKTNLEKYISENIDLHKDLINLQSEIDKAIIKIYQTIRYGGKILICGNGGSAADAQHLSAEFLIRLKKKNKRKSFPVISLATDTSTLTACGNDLGFDQIFSRTFEGLANKKDLLLSISTSGNSKNIINVIKTSKKNKIYSISLLGSGGGKAKKFSNLNIIVPHYSTARIQEAHIFLGHLIFEEVENLLIS